MKKHTVPNEPEEFPIIPERPEISQPNDPREPEIPWEGNENIPQELPPFEDEPLSPNPDQAPGES